MLVSSGDPDQTPHSAASDLGLHCLSMPHKKDALDYITLILLYKYHYKGTMGRPERSVNRLGFLNTPF